VEEKNSMLTYSIVIRTLGTAEDKFREELISITKQTVQPEQVIVYIAEGYARPDFTIGREEYCWVKKGMMAQRLLPYENIESDCLMMLDDDLSLAPDSAERMLKAMEQYKADCVGADLFRNHEMSVLSKVYAALTNWVFPHRDPNWAFKIHRYGSFSYINRPQKSFYWSQSCPGAISVWRKTVYQHLRMMDELWLDAFEFAYADDMLEFYKIHQNGYKLGVLFDAGVKNLSANSASSAFHRSASYFYTRTKATFCIWWRSCYALANKSTIDRYWAACCYVLKAAWLFPVMIIASLVFRQISIVPLYIKGLLDGWKFVHGDAKFVQLPNYIVSR
jgi:GT2 family glycosyltransferase